VTPTGKPPSGAADAVAEPDPLNGAPILEEFLQLDPEKVPPAVGNLLAVFREPVDSYEQLGDEAISAQAVRAIVTEIVTRQRTEREVFVAALGAYKDLTERLAVEVADARSELSAQAELAQLERAQLLQEFLDRLDLLTAKISTSAGRYEAELADKNVLLEDRERRVEIYAGQAINAQNMLADIQRSTSWRVTAPVRLLSRMLARRATSGQPEN
jgi:hypothetical protein